MRDAIRQRSEGEGGGLPRGLADAMAYAALGPGKRVRPLLTLRAWECIETLRAEGTPATESVRKPGPLDAPGPSLDAAGLPGGASGVWEAAAALELVHAFSLVHDDLPALDNDDLRRGRPTLHRHADEATAILAGDALLTLSLELLATGVADPALAVRLIGELSSATNDMIGGQMRDTRPDDRDAGALAGATIGDLDHLVLIHRQKTGALLRAAARMGGLCGGAEAGQLAALTDFADAVGLMFQVIDDLLDVTSDHATLGKATQKDASAGKLTYPGLLGVEVRGPRPTGCTAGPSMPSSRWGRRPPRCGTWPTPW